MQAESPSPAQCRPSRGSLPGGDAVEAYDCMVVTAQCVFYSLVMEQAMHPRMAWFLSERCTHKRVYGYDCNNCLADVF